jgi:hypothetical protein
VYTVDTAGKLEILLTGTTAQKQYYYGDYTFELQVKQYITPFDLLGTKTISVTIEDCENVWLPNVNQANIDYILGTSTSVNIPSFVNITLGSCYPVTTSFISPAGNDLTTAITINQMDSYQGNATLIINTDNMLFRGT